MRSPGTLYRLFSPSGLSVRLVLQVLILSVVLTVVLTVLQLYVNYRTEVATIEQRLDEIENGPLNSVANSLWNVDITNLTLLVEGIYRLPDMQAVELRETLKGVDHPVFIIMGKRSDRHVVARDFILSHTLNTTTQEIGRLHIEISLASVLERLREQSVIVVLSHGLRALLIAAAVLYLVHAHITRHLVAMAEAIGRFDLQGDKPGITLPHKRRRTNPDELDVLTDAFNTLSHDLRQSYGDLAASNHDLTLARQQADANAQRLRDVNEELQRLAMVTAHHLREPLRPIMISAQCIQRHPAGQTEDIQQWSAQITNSVVHLHALLRDFHRYVGALVENPRLESVHLEGIAISANQHLQTQTPQEALVTIGPLPTVTGDRKMLHEIFHQLFSNALQHRRRSDPVHVLVKAERIDDHWQIVITDDGPGIPVEMAERVFKVFENVHGRAVDQTGLGLPMCKAMLRAQGGTIWVAPAQGGTEIRFTVPDASSPA